MGGRVDEEKDDQLLQLLARGLNQNEVAREMGVSRQRVSQRIKALKARGVRVTRPPRTTPKVLMKALDTSFETLNQILKDLGLAKGKKGSPLLLSEEQAGRVKEEFNKRTIIPCKRCGVTFRKITNEVYCKACRPTAYREFHSSPAPAGEDNIRPPLRPYLVLRGVEPGEEWVTHPTALDITGLTHTKMEWLVKRGLLAMKRDPTRVHNATGQFCRLYSLAHCRKIAQIRKEVEPGD